MFISHKQEKDTLSKLAILYIESFAVKFVYKIESELERSSIFNLFITLPIYLITWVYNKL